MTARHASWNPGTKRLDRPSPAPILKHDHMPSLHVSTKLSRYTAVPAIERWRRTLHVSARSAPVVTSPYAVDGACPSFLAAWRARRATRWVSLIMSPHVSVRLPCIGSAAPVTGIVVYEKGSPTEWSTSYRNATHRPNECPQTGATPTPCRPREREAA